eukprot:1436029-Prymnesium_polylepis.2
MARSELSVRSCGAATVVATAAQVPRGRARARGGGGARSDFVSVLQCGVSPHQCISARAAISVHTLAVRARKGCATRGSCMFGVAVVRGQPACVCYGSTGRGTWTGHASGTRNMRVLVV